MSAAENLWSEVDAVKTTAEGAHKEITDAITTIGGIVQRIEESNSIVAGQLGAGEPGFDHARQELNKASNVLVDTGTKIEEALELFNKALEALSSIGGTSV